ncbi:MAG: hypothetical protein ACE5KM_12815 [Planctomycetaceae bacterium]
MAVAQTHQETLLWSVHPARTRPWATVCALIVVIGAAWGTAEWMGHIGWAALAIAFFAITLHRFFLPSEFRIDDAGVTAKSAFTSAFFRWQDVRRFQHDRRGGFLSTRRRATLFDAFGGIHLVFRDNREEVVRRIEQRLKEGATP